MMDEFTPEHMKAVNLISKAVSEFDPSRLKQPEINLDRLSALDIAWYCWRQMCDCPACDCMGKCHSEGCHLDRAIPDMDMDDFHAT